MGSQVKGTSAVLQSSQLTSKHSRSLRIHYVTTKRHADCHSMERYLKGRPNTILKQSKFNQKRSPINQTFFTTFWGVICEEGFLELMLTGLATYILYFDVI